MPNYAAFNTNADDLRTLIFGRDGTTSRPVAVDSNGHLLIGGVTITSATIAGGTLDAVLGATITAGTLTAVEGATITAGTLTAVEGATITAGTLTAVESATITAGTLDAVLGATITAGTLTAVESATITAGTLDAVLGATITAGTLTAVESATITAGTLDAVLGATITAGTLTAVEGATITAGTLDSVTSISQKSFVEIADLAVNTGDAFTPLAAVTTAVLGTYSYFIYNSGANEADAQIEISADGTNWYVDVSTASPIASGSVDVLVPKRFLKYTRLSYRSTNAGQSTTLDIYFNAQGT